jgi:hypothetical protein
MARKFVIDKYCQANVRLLISGLDRFGGFVAEVWAQFAGGQEFDIGKDLLEEGFADLLPSFNGSTPPDDLKGILEVARAEGRGIWSDRTRHGRHMVLGHPEPVRVVQIADMTTLTIQWTGEDYRRVNALLRMPAQPLNGRISRGQCLLCTVDGEVVRVRIDEVMEKEAIVDLIDYGEMRKVPLASLRATPEGAIEIEPLAMQVKLAFVDPRVGDEEDLEPIWEVCREATLWAHLITNSKIPRVLLTDGQSLDAGSLNMHLLQQGLVVFAKHPVAEGYEKIMQMFRAESMIQ